MTVVHDDKLFAELARLRTTLPADSVFLALLDARYGSFTSGAGAPGGTGTKGQRYYDTTNDRLYLSDGGGWVITAEPTITTFAPVVTTTAGVITTLGAVSMSYRRNDGWLAWNLSIAITTNGTGAGAVRFTLPKNAAAAWAACGREVGVSGSQLSVTGAVATADIGTYNNAYPGANGAVLLCSGQYPMTTRYS